MFSLKPMGGSLTYPAIACGSSVPSGAQATIVPSNLRCMGNSAVQMRESIRRESAATYAMLAASARNASGRLACEIGVEVYG